MRFQATMRIFSMTRSTWKIAAQSDMSGENIYEVEDEDVVFGGVLLVLLNHHLVLESCPTGSRWTELVSSLTYAVMLGHELISVHSFLRLILQLLLQTPLSGPLPFCLESTALYPSSHQHERPATSTWRLPVRSQPLHHCGSPRRPEPSPGPVQH